MFIRIINFKSTTVTVLFFVTVFFMGILWGSVHYNGLADTLSNRF